MGQAEDDQQGYLRHPDHTRGGPLQDAAKKKGAARPHDRKNSAPCIADLEAEMMQAAEDLQRNTPQKAQDKIKDLESRSKSRFWRAGGRSGVPTLRS